MLSKNLEKTLHRALSIANEQKHEYANLEHLLLALTKDPDASLLLEGCGVSLRMLQDDLSSYLDGLEDAVDPEDLELPFTDGSSKPTTAFQRVLQRAAIHVQSSGREEVNGDNVIVALFSERESDAVYFLSKQGMARFDAVNFLSHGIEKNSDFSANEVVEEEEIEEFSIPPRLISMETQLENEKTLILESIFVSQYDRQKNHSVRLKELSHSLGGNVEFCNPADNVDLFILQSFQNQLKELNFTDEQKVSLCAQNALYEMERYAGVVQYNPIKGINLEDIKADLVCGAELGFISDLSGEQWLIYSAAAGVFLIRIAKPIFSGAAKGAAAAAEEEAKKRGFISGIVAFFQGTEKNADKNIQVDNSRD